MQQSKGFMLDLGDGQAAKGTRQGPGNHRARSAHEAAHRLDIAGQVIERMAERQQAAHLSPGRQQVQRLGGIFGEIDGRLLIQQADARTGAEAFRRRGGRPLRRGAPFAKAEMRLGEKWPGGGTAWRDRSGKGACRGRSARSTPPSASRAAVRSVPVFQ